MSKKIIIILITLSLVFTLISAVNAVELRTVNFIMSGNSMEIDTLQLEPKFTIEGGHQGGLNLAFDGDDFHIGAELGLNMIAQEEFKMDLQLMLTDQVDNQNFGKAVGISAETLNSEWNFYWQTFYFINDNLDKHAYYRGGGSYSLGPRTELDLSVGNQYWDLDNRVFNFGLNFKI